MSSFESPHHLYLFDMTNGRKKLAYGSSPEDALEILALRLPPEEMALVERERFTQISQRQLQQYVHLLG